MLIDIKDKLIEDIKNYCKINNIEDYIKVINHLLYKGLMVSKYGYSPVDNKHIEQIGTTDFTTTQEINENDKKSRTVTKATEDRSSNEHQVREEKKDVLPQEEAKSEVKEKTVKKRIIKRTIQPKK